MKYIKKITTYILVFNLILSILLPFNQVSALTNPLLINTEEDFEEGTIDSSLDSTFIPGDLRLKYKTVSHTDTTDEDFAEGSTTENILSTHITTDDSGKVNIGKNYNYTSTTTPAIVSSYVPHSFLDSTNNLLYVSTAGGLSVINTQGTISPDDDTLVVTYTTSTTPAIGNNFVYHSFFDSTSNLLYVSTYGGGLSVINTQGTITSADDTLVITYTSSTTPAIADNYVHHSFFDETNNLIYISTFNGGLSVINRGTDPISPSDDTLVITYKTNTTPAIGGNALRHSFLDETNNLIYVSTSGGLSVINTQGTISPADDTLVITYSTTSIPAIVGNAVVYSFLDSTNNLLYVSTNNGLSIINTQGTVDSSDDTLVKTYTTSTNPALNANNSVSFSLVDQINNLLYISSWNGGLFTTNLNDTYNDQGTYIKTIFNEEENFWTEKEVLPAVRMSGGGGIIDGKIYIAGGQTAWNNKLNSLISFNPANNEYELLSSMSTTRATPVSGVINNRLYVAGGQTGTSGSLPLSSLEIYDPSVGVGGIWTTGPSMNKARIGASGGVYDGKLYVVGGTSESCGLTSETTMEVYDPLTNTWEYKASAPVEKLTSSTAQFINGKMYIAGGQTYCSGGDSNALLSYDVATDTWDTDLAQMPSARAGGSSVVLDGKFIYIGGSNSEYDSTLDIYSYDPTTDIWGTLSSLPEEIHRSMPFVIDGNLYVMGGRNYDLDAIDTNYFLSSTYLSDTYQKEKYTNITFNTTTPSGTEVEMYYSLDGGNTYTSLGTEEGSYNLNNDTSYDFKYKAILRTDDPDITPSLDDVTISYAEEYNGYYESNEGTYISSVLDGDTDRKWSNLEIDDTIPEGTSITYYTRTGDTDTPDGSWNDWEEVIDNNISSNKSQYIQIKAILSTTNTETPVIHSIEPRYNVTSSGSFSSSQYTNLITMGNIEQANELLTQFPNQINPQVTVPTTSTPSTPTIPSTSSGQVTRTLKQGIQGDDVKQLQIYLNTHGYIVSLTGPGSPNNETNYFGKLTKQAVIKFQIANQLVGDGIVGPLTRGKLK